MKVTIKKTTVFMMILALVLGGLAVPSQDAQAAKKKVSITKEVKVTMGKTKKIKLKNNKKKVKWKVIKGKKLIKITKKTKSYATVRGIKKGTAKVQAVVGKKKYTCKVTVSAAKKKPTATSKPQSAKTPVPTTSPSGNTSGGTDGNTPTPTAPTPTSSPSGSMPTPVVPTPTPSPDGEVRTIIYDSQALDSECWKAVRDAEEKGEPYHLVLTDGFACDGFSHMVKVTLPDNLTKIKDEEFLGCSSLTEITIPDSVTSIGESAFRGCSSLTSMIIPEGVTSIENGSIFANCDSLTTIKVSEKNAVYDSRDNCNAIIKTDTNALIAGSNSTVIPETVTSIGEAAFVGCNNLTSITIPEGVKSIGNGAFSGCKSLESITIPEGVTSIGQWAFSDCGVWKSEGGESWFIASLVSVTIPDSVTSIGKGAFQRAMNITWKVTTYTNVDSFEEAFGGFGKNDD